ncbi:MAG: lysylphosphatidylglycerol synthase transmembrane domain-containing protein [Planctomycetota bacterium]
MRKVAFYTLKVAVAGGLLYWLFHRGDIGEDVLSRAAAGPWDIGMVLVLQGAILVLSIVRLRWLLGAVGVSATLGDTARYTFIGLFIALLGPGAAVGDTVKTVYLARGSSRKTETVLAVVVDRLMGFMGLVLLAFAGLLFNLPLFLAGRFRPVMYAVGVAAGVCGVILLFLLIRPGRRVVPGEKGWFARFREAVDLYRNRPGTLGMCLLISLAVHVMVVISFLFLGRALGEASVGFGKAATLVPVGLALNSLGPFGGIGVGEAAFKTIYKLAGSTLGGDVCFLYHVLFLIWGLAGMVVFLVTPMPAGTLKEAGQRQP